MHKVTLIARVKEIQHGGLRYRYERVETQRRGKAVPAPKQPEHATGFYLRYRRNGKTVMEPAGKGFDDAVRMLRNKELEQEYAKRGIDVPNLNDPGRLILSDAVDAFVKKQTTLGKASATVYAYTHAVNQFRDCCHKRFLDEVNQDDVLAYIDYIQKNAPKRTHGQRNGTIRTRLTYMTCFFTDNGMKNPLPKRQWPKAEERKVEAYTPEQLTTLFSKATEDETDLIQFLLCTGMRDDEAAHAIYSDVDFKAGTVKVGPKPEIAWTTKNKRERVIPVPADLLDRLKARRKRNAKDVYIFPNRDGRPDTCLLARVRVAAKRAGMTERITLHKFRKTFGTRYGEKHGVVNAQHLLGHQDIRTTQRYMAQTRIAKSAVDALFSDVVGK